MAPELEEIKHIRKKLDLTQSDLAKLAGVSQSLIAKVEAGIMDPTYTNAKKIFSALEELGKKKQVSAQEIMNARIISVSPSDKVHDVVKKMKRHGISQLPVIDEGKAVGLISETLLLDAVMKKKDCRIEEVMGDAPPTIGLDSSLEIIGSLLHHYPMVLIGEKGRIKGVITKADLIAKAYR